jgi:ubiquinone/menaquinone biosynthesis C-methylase UbiE
MGTQADQPAEQRDPDEQWFWEHYGEAADQTLGFLGAVGIATQGSLMADIGCGDGILSLGLAHKGQPARLTGFDVVPTDRETLLARARRYGVASELPSELEFQSSGPTALPADDGSFDVVTTWSAFEHVTDPAALLGEIRRVLRPQGVLFLQLWPFYHSERGSHLWDWFPEGFHHLGRDVDEIVAEMVRSGARDADWTNYMAREFRHLNRVTLDELQRCLLGAGLDVRRMELLSHTVNLPGGLDRYRLSELGIAGVKLLAVPTG